VWNGSETYIKLSWKEVDAERLERAGL
jgi:hypothetical protein